MDHKTKDKALEAFAQWLEDGMQSDLSPAQEMLNAGVPIFYADESSGEIIREHPDGKKEVVTSLLDENDNSLKLVSVKTL